MGEGERERERNGGREEVESVYSHSPYLLFNILELEFSTSPAFDVVDDFIFFFQTLQLISSVARVKHAAVYKCVSGFLICCTDV